MRPRLLPLLALAAAGLAGAPPASAATSRPDARAFSKATLAYDLARGKAVGRAERRGDARRAAALGCLDAARAAPTRHRDEVLALYLGHVGGGYFAEDEPIFARWVKALERVRTTDAALRRARSTLAAQLLRTRAGYARAGAFCGPVQAWAAAGWKAATRPATFRTADARAAAGAHAGLTAAARVLELRGGAGSRLAAAVLREGIDEPDELVVKGEDPIVRALI